MTTSEVRISNLHIFGRIFIGLIISALLGGVTIAQIITFTKKSKKDPLGQKLVVWFIWLLDMLHLIFMVHMVYHYLVSHPTDPGMVWSFPAHILIQIIILPAAQWLYVTRIWKITNQNHKILPVILGFLVILDFAAGVFTVLKLFHTPIVRVTHHLPAETAITFFLSMTSFLDFLIAGSLCYSLNKAGTNLRWTNSSFIMLLAYLVNTGALVSLFSVSVLITYLVTKPASTFIAVGAVNTGLYVNSFLGMVNARHYFQPSKPSMALVLHSETSSQYGPMNKTSQRQSKTINEAGLPLFQPSSKCEDIKMLEVMVKQEAHSSKM